MTLSKILKQGPIFKNLSDEAIEKLAAKMTTRTLQASEILFNLGDPGNELIVVQEGKIAIYMPDVNRPQAGQALRIFQDNELLGEMALIDRLPRSASARAETRAVISTLDGETFKKVLADQPETALAVMGGLSSRIRYTADFLGEIRQWVRRLAEGNYQAIQTPLDLQDNSLSTLAHDFVRMAAQVREREEKLQQEIAQLRIQIDENKRQQEVNQIRESDYYINLKEKLKSMREQAEDD